MKTHLRTPLRIVLSVSVAASTLACGVAMAHPGHLHEAAANMLASGLLHPLTGLDHLFAMVAVGLWAATTRDNLSQALWAPFVFASLLLLGALAGLNGMRLPAVEPMIVASLLVLGLLLATRLALPGVAGAAVAGFFAVFHGLAHGVELPAGGSAASFIAGFMLSTAALHALGLAAGLALKRRSTWLPRLAGAGTAAYGLALLAA